MVDGSDSRRAALKRSLAPRRCTLRVTIYGAALEEGWLRARFLLGGMRLLWDAAMADAFLPALYFTGHGLVRIETKDSESPSGHGVTLKKDSYLHPTHQVERWENTVVYDPSTGG